MAKAAVVSFSMNELHELHVAYVISAMKLSVEVISIFNYDINVSDVSFYDIIAYAPDLLVVYITFGCYNSFCALIKLIKDKMPNSIIIACGSLASILVDRILGSNPNIDAIIWGEIEGCWKHISSISDFSDRKKRRRIPGLCFLDNGKLVKNPPYFMNTLSEMPLPSREFIAPAHRTEHLYGSRGCEGNCSFCYRNALYNMFKGQLRYRVRSVNDIVGEIDGLVDQYCCKYTDFSDATFCSTAGIMERLYSMYQLLKEKNYWFQFSMSLRAEQIDEFSAMRLKDLATVGLGSVFVGIESLNTIDLKLYRKIANIYDNLRALKLMKNTMVCNGYLLRMEVGFINFHPYTDRESIIENVNRLTDCGVYLSPYMMSSRMTVNYLTSIVSRINADGLLLHPLESMNLNDLMGYSYKYHFLHDDVEELYSAVKFCEQQLKVGNINGYEITRNRYYHFYGNDALLQRFDHLYFSWYEQVDRITRKLMLELLSLKHIDQSYINNIMNKLSPFVSMYRDIYNKLRACKLRLYTQLQKIGENI